MFAKGLPSNYELEVKKVDTLDDVIVASQNIEDMIVRKRVNKNKGWEKKDHKWSKVVD